MNATTRTSNLLTSHTETIRSRSELTARGIVGDVLAGVADGRLKPGDRLPDERSLCGHYRAGRHTVRKAMTMLERQGLIGRFVGRGSFVLDPAPRSVLAPEAAESESWTLYELTEARLLLEPGIAGLAAERACPEDVARLQTSLLAIETSASWRAFKEAKYAFHRQIATVARNEFIGDVFDRIIASRRRAWDGYQPRNQDLAGVRSTCVNECGAILAAVAVADPEGAAEAVRRSITRLLVSIGGC